MKTKITTIEEAAAVVGRMVYAIGDEGLALRLEEPFAVDHCGANVAGAFVVVGGAMLSLPVTLHLATAQPEQHTSALATWEATVRPALVRAMAKHGELWGAAITLEGQFGDIFEVKLSGKGWDATRGIGRTLVCEIEADCAALAMLAAGEAAKAREAGGVDLRARALAYGGDVPLVAGEEPSGHPAADVLRYAEERRVERDTEAPEGYAFSDVAGPCGERSVFKMTVRYGDGISSCIWHLYSDTIDTNNAGWAKAHPKAFDFVRARLLAAAAQWAGEAAARPSSERTPLPAGWSWNTKRPCDVIGPCRGWIGVYPGGDIVNMTDAPVPFVIRAALITEAKRLGLPCHEEMPTAPKGYRFLVGDASPMPPGFRGVYIDKLHSERNESRDAAYWPSGHAEAFKNACPRRWRGHEYARQWAAYLLGEVAPPLREEGASA